MSVLTLAGKKIDWAKPPKGNARVMWSKKTTGGKKVIGSLRTIAHLDHLNTLAVKKFGRGIEVIQGPYNTGVAASAGTHDYDACSDLRIPGVPWREQEKFFRANGYGCWYRRKPAFSTEHIHGFTLPQERGEGDPSKRFRAGGFKVGIYVDGGWSTKGRKVGSSQIADYYDGRTGLSGHAKDTGSWFPSNISKTIFDLTDYIRRQRAAQPAPSKPAAAKAKPVPGDTARKIRVYAKEVALSKSKTGAERMQARRILAIMNGETVPRTPAVPIPGPTAKKIRAHALAGKRSRSKSAQEQRRFERVANIVRGIPT